MDEYHERQVSHATVWSRRTAVFSFVLLLTAGLSHRFGFIDTSEISPVLATALAIAGLSLLFALRALFLFYHYGGKGGGSLVFAILIALLVLTPFGITGYRSVTLPLLNDISTDPDDPPELAQAEARRVAGMNAIEGFTPEKRRMQEERYPTVTGRRYEAPIGQVLEVVIGLLDDRRWTIVSPTEFPPDATEMTVEAEAASPLLGFPADVAIRLIDEDTSTYVDMRSASRYGPHDFGDNAARIEAFLAELDTEVAYLNVVTPVEPEPPPPPKLPETAPPAPSVTDGSAETAAPPLERDPSDLDNMEVPPD